MPEPHPPGGGSAACAASGARRRGATPRARPPSRRMIRRRTAGVRRRQRPVPVVQRDQRRPVHLAKDETARAVDGSITHVKARSLSASRALRRGCRGRMETGNLGADDRLGGAIRDRDRIVAPRTALVLDIERDAKMRQDRLARGERHSVRELDVFRNQRTHAVAIQKPERGGGRGERHESAIRVGPAVAELRASQSISARTSPSTRSYQRRTQRDTRSPVQTSETRAPARPPGSASAGHAVQHPMPIAAWKCACFASPDAPAHDRARERGCACGRGHRACAGGRAHAPGTRCAVPIARSRPASRRRGARPRSRAGRARSGRARQARPAHGRDPERVPDAPVHAERPRTMAMPHRERRDGRKVIRPRPDMQDPGDQPGEDLDHVRGAPGRRLRTRKRPGQPTPCHATVPGGTLPCATANRARIVPPWWTT